MIRDSLGIAELRDFRCVSGRGWATGPPRRTRGGDVLARASDLLWEPPTIVHAGRWKLSYRLVQLFATDWTDSTIRRRSGAAGLSVGRSAFAFGAAGGAPPLEGAPAPVFPGALAALESARCSAAVSLGLRRALMRTS